MRRSDERKVSLGERARRVLTARVLIPLVIGLGLLAYVIDAAIARKTGAELLGVIRQTWALVLVLMIPYLACRLVVWYQLLQELDVDVPWRHLIVAFAGGEMTKSLPAGIYVENFILERVDRLGRVETVRSTVATTVLLGLESALAVPVVLIFGIPGAPWVRWLLLGVVVAWLVILAGIRLLVSEGAQRLTSRTARWLCKFALTANEFFQAAIDLIQPKTLISLLPTAIYMLIYATYLYAIALALGVHHFSFLNAVEAYAVVLLAVILIPIPTELGIAEFTGLGALLAYGVPHATAALVMIGLRVEGTGATILVSLVVFLLFRRGVRPHAQRADRRASA